ncbi:hypothetical protein ABES58_10370 [Paenibacillus lautus]|uniref:hypothetical protein n=1 Tax=Paenibacillus lautus TaxID=1401 RepID=UPI003D2BE63F
MQVSTDTAAPVNWTEVYSNSTGDGGMDEISFAARDARYVRMYGTARGTSYGYFCTSLRCTVPLLQAAIRIPAI